MFVLEKPKTFKTKIYDFWNKLFPKKDYVVFKIDEQKINLLCYSVAENQKIILAAETILIENLIENINKQDTKDSFRFLLKKFIKKNNIKPKSFIGIIPEKKYFYQIIKAEDENNVLNIIKNKINEYEIYDIENIEPLDQVSNHKDYAVWITNKNYLNSINNVFQLMNIDVLEFSPENKNVIYAIFDNFQTKDAYLIINVSKNITNLIIFAGSAIHFSGFLNYGLINFEENFNNFLDEINKLIYFYIIKSTHEHGASSKINKILINEEVEKNFLSLIALNTKIEVEKIKIDDNLNFKNEIVKDYVIKNKFDFIALIGFVKSFKLNNKG